MDAIERTRQQKAQELRPDSTDNHSHAIPPVSDVTHAVLKEVTGSRPQRSSKPEGYYTQKLIEEALAIEAEDAKEVGAVGYMARAMVQATMPHSPTDKLLFRRENGAYRLTMIGHPELGLPFGSYPRLLLSWLTTEAVLSKSPEIELGPTLSSFMRELGLIPAGGRWGTIHRLRDQMKRVFSTSVSCEYQDDFHDAGAGFRITRSYSLWWDPKAPDQAALWKSFVLLSKDFFDEIIKNPVPIDIRVLKTLKRSPLALDIYCWLTYRMSYLKKATTIPWEALQFQFGADYSTKGQGPRDFKRAFLKHLRAVFVVYPEARVEQNRTGLLLKPSKPHLPMLPRG